MNQRILLSIVLSGVLGFEKKKYKAIYAFGDSISDNGNLYELMGHKTPNDKMYYKGRFSNGPVWIEYVAEAMNATLQNMAYASATTDNDKFLGKGGWLTD
ncbi:hypothetical protein DSO57_1031478 [Entomophthora muscae]|uniref:Uncharacterized protein n=1 Tax=Entomophthora muscae TaxID=34485 RepID=A0ACC2TMJ3_9FUNG|nr:hypothetical protein DSO57_1031478 [Entomophthora muscae]